MFQTVASAQVAEEKLSNVVFDIRVDKALAFLESVGMETDLVFGPAVEGDMIKSIVRIYGAVQLPPDMETGMALIEIMEMGHQLREECSTCFQRYPH